MKKVMVAMVFLAGGLFAAPRVTFGIGIGVRAPVAVVRPACPGPGYTWVDGYNQPNGVWVNGYWAPPVVNYGYDRDHDRRVDFDRGRGIDHQNFDRDQDRRDDHFRR